MHVDSMEMHFRMTPSWKRTDLVEGSPWPRRRYYSSRQRATDGGEEEAIHISDFTVLPKAPNVSHFPATPVGGDCEDLDDI